MKSMILFCLLFVMTPMTFSQVSISIRQPFGPIMCREFCKRFLGCSSHEFNASDLVCRVIYDTHSKRSERKPMKEKIEREDITELDHCYTHYTDATRTKEQGSSGYTPNKTLHQACEEGKLCVVEYILKNRLTDINCRGKLGRTPVMVAASMGQFTVFDYLVNEGCDLSVVDERNNNVLHVACMYGNTDIVRKLLESKLCDIESRGWQKWTPVMFAVQFGHRNVTDLLISKGCDVTSMSRRKENILHVACTGGHVDMVKYILSRDIVSIDSRGHSKKTPVIMAAGKGYTPVVDLLVSKGCNVKAVDVNRNNILHCACIGGHIDMVKYILRNNLSTIESRGFRGMTPVSKAVQHGHRNLVDLLVKEGCNLKVKDDYNFSVLHSACIGGNVDMVNYILSEYLFSIETKGFLGRTPVITAARYGYKAVVDLLVKKGCNLRATDEQMNNILHITCIYGHVHIVSYVLLQKVVDVDSKGYHLKTPVMVAVEYGQKEVVDLLVSNKCNLKALDAYKNNILHIACYSGHLDMVKYILKKNEVSIESIDIYGRTPMLLAAGRGNRDVVSFLLHKKSNPRAVDDGGNNVLHAACLGGRVDMVKYLIKRKLVDEKKTNKIGSTPVQVAESGGHTAIVALLKARS